MPRCWSTVTRKVGPRARTALEKFWRRVSEAARFSPFRRGPLDVLLGRWTLDSSPIYVTMDIMSRLLSPYDLNPMGNNPLRAILAEIIDFERLAEHLSSSSSPHQCSDRPRSCVQKQCCYAGRSARFGLSAHHVSSHRDRRRALLGWRLFRNPTISPLVQECKSQDTILVQINPVEREGRPRSASEILNRLNEASFNAVLLKELRMIALLRQVAIRATAKARNGPACASTASRARC